MYRVPQLLSSSIECKLIGVSGKCVQILRYVVFERRLTTHSIRGEGAYYSVLGCGIIHFDEKVMTKFHLVIEQILAFSIYKYVF